MSRPSIEDDIRLALRRRADSAPASARLTLPQVPRRRSMTLRVGAMVAAATCIAAVAAREVTIHGQEDQAVASRAADAPRAALQPTTAGPRELPDAPVPRLGFDAPGFTFARELNCAKGAPPFGTSPLRGGRPVFQSFGRSYEESPLLFVETLKPSDLSHFGLYDSDNGDPFVVRGVTGYVATERGTGRGWGLSVRLPDGRALFVNVLGLDLDTVTTVLDGLVPRADGGWDPGTLPPGMRELAPSNVSEDGAYYDVSGSLPTVSDGTFEINLYNDAFDQRLADRAMSTTGVIESVEIDGVPAALGSYRADDHWVMFEPQPGRTMEIRASSMTREAVKNLLHRAVFVDEQTWRTMCPAG